MSAAYRPDGTLIAGEQEEEGLIIADLDFEWLRAYRKQFPFYQDRRLEIYEQFYHKEDKRES
jgi:predicted amidohydrolase